MRSGLARIGRRGSVVLLAILAASLLFRLQKSPPTIPAPDESRVERTIEHEGATYKIYRGSAYKVGPDPGRWTLFEELYDPHFFIKNYEVVDGIPHKKDPETGKLYATRRQFAEDFEQATSLTGYIGPERGWTSFTLQSPAAPSIAEYNALRQRIMSGEGGPLDNQIEVSTERAHSGLQSLKCFSLAPSRGMITAKASLTTSLLHYVKGDEFWYSGWYFVPTGSPLPFTLADLESSWIKEHPGMRIMLDPPGFLMLELKTAGKPSYRQPKGKETAFPVGRWVRLDWHLHLSDQPDGLAELWQDGEQILSARGQTLPLASTIYDDLEIGISAHSFGPDPATLFVDDIAVSTVRIR